MKRAVLTLTLSLLVTSAAIGQAAALKPDTTHNVGVGEILAPRGSADSGQPLIPRIIVNNYGTSTETFQAYVRVGMFLDSVPVTGLPGRISDTVEFDQWTPLGRDSMTAVSWTVCPDDTFPDDDTVRSRFLIRVKDVAVTGIVGPVDTLDSGVVVHPRAAVWNYGNQTQTFPLEFRIGSWVSRATVMNLIPGGQQEIVAPDPYYTVPGMYLHRVTAILPGDLHPENNALRDTFWVRGTITCDLMIVRIHAPCGAYDTLDTIIPRVTIGGYSFRPETCGVWFTIENPDDSVVYRESLTVVVQPGVSLDVEFPPTRLRELGRHTATCSLYCVHDQNHLNNVMSAVFYVFPCLAGGIGIVAVGLPRDTTDTLTTWYPWVRLHNYGYWLDSVKLFITFSDTSHDRLVYSESAFCRVWPGADTHVSFRVVRFRSLGPHDGLCSLWAFRPDTNSPVRWRFWVVPRLGAAEWSVPDASWMPPATVCRGVLFLPQSPVANRQAPSALLDATGRKVLALKPGRNDVRHLPAGVYFVRLEPSAVSRQPSAVAKVVIQR